MKNNFESQFNQKKQTTENILNEWDKKILLEGCKNVVTKILSEFNGKLPDAIVYPDTSARPVYYLLDPVFSKIAKNKNINKPKIFFLKVHGPDRNTSVYESTEERELGKEEAEVFLLKELARNRSLYSHSNLFAEGEYDEYEKNQKDDFNRTFEKRHTEKERAIEIDNYNQKISENDTKANIAVIDEYSSNGHTSKEINYAFGYEVPYFSIFGSKEDNYVPGENIGKVVDIYEDDRNPANEKMKLSYSMGESKKAIGVEKDSNINSRYSEINKNQTKDDKEKIAKLRQEMKELGMQISQNFK